VVHDSGTGGEDDVSNTSSGQELIDPFLKIWETDVKSGGNDAAFI